MNINRLPTTSEMEPHTRSEQAHVSEYMVTGLERGQRSHFPNQHSTKSGTFGESLLESAYHRTRLAGKCRSMVMAGMAVVTTPARKVVIPVLYVTMPMTITPCPWDTGAGYVANVAISGGVEDGVSHSLLVPLGALDSECGRTAAIATTAWPFAAALVISGC